MKFENTVTSSSKNVKKLGNTTSQNRNNNDARKCDVMLAILRDSKQITMIEHEQKSPRLILQPVRGNTQETEGREIKESREGSGGKEESNEGDETDNQRTKQKVTKLSNIDIRTFNQCEPNDKRTKISLNINRSENSTVYADDLTPDALQAIKHASIKALPSWERITPRLRIMYLQEALVKSKPCVAFTLNLSEAVIEAAYQSGNFTSYMREKIRRKLKYMTEKSPFPEDISYVFAVEAHHYPREQGKPRIDQTAPHIHGVISIPSSDGWEHEIKAALKAAGGGGLPRQVHLNMEDRLIDGSYIKWCGGYATKLLDHNIGLITGKSIASTQDLMKIGKALYNHDRQQVSNYKRNCLPSLPASFNVSKTKVENSSSASPSKEEVLEEKTLTIDPGNINQPSFSSGPFLSFQQKFAKFPEDAARSSSYEKKNYTPEEVDELLSELS